MNPQWITTALNEVTVGDILNVELLVQHQLPATSHSISLLNNSLPPGLAISENHIIGTVGQTDGEHTFTLRATDDYGRIADRTFTMTVDGAVIPVWNSPTELLTTYDSVWVNLQLEYESTTAASTELYSGDLPSGLELTQTGIIRGYPAIPMNGTTPVDATYSFSIVLANQYGNVVKEFTITVLNQTPGLLYDARRPVITNTKPEIGKNTPDNQDFQYYNSGNFGTFDSGDMIVFKILGVDFDGSELEYEFTGLPPGLSPSVSGWVSGVITLPSDSIVNYSFSVRVAKSQASSLSSDWETYQFTVVKALSNDITWITDGDLGSISNGAVSTFQVFATSATPLTYEITGGSLPENLSLHTDGNLVGRISFQLGGISTIKSFSFTVTATSTLYDFISSTKTFTFTVVQEYATPYDTLYFVASMDAASRSMVSSLLSNTTIFPEADIYRPYDANFGITSGVRFAFNYGMRPVTQESLANAMAKSHYFKPILFGNVQTAVARKNDEVIYEVVYLPIIDDSEVDSESVARIVPLDSPAIINGSPTYYVYPNSYFNMMAQLSDTLEFTQSESLMPLWMTCQQDDGGTIGFIRAWVICHIMPGKSSEIAAKISTKFNELCAVIDRYYVDKSASYDFNPQWENPNWAEIPGASPPPAVLNTYDHCAYFAQRTILNGVK